MAGWAERLKRFLGGTSKPAPQKGAGSKTKLGKTRTATASRTDIIAEAMAIHRRGRAHAQGILERTFKELQSKPPKPSDLDGMTRMLALRQAVLSMKGHIAQDLKRLGVLAEIKTPPTDGANPPPVLPPVAAGRRSPGPSTTKR